jgi:hypothetical protein
VLTACKQVEMACWKTGRWLEIEADASNLFVTIIPVSMFITVWRSRCCF